MSRLPKNRQTGEFRRRKRASGPVKLLQSHNKRIRILCDFYNEEALQFLSLMIGKASADLYCHALLNSRTALYDRKVYDTYSDIIRSYGEVSEDYKKNENSVQDESVSKILDGLHRIMKSRLEEFEWTVERLNPVEEEKVALLNGVLKDFYQQIEDQVEEPFHHVLADIEKRVSSVLLLADYNALEVIHQGVLDIVLDRMLDTLYEVYCQQMMNAIGQLDNLANRKVLNEYLSALKQEYDILESIIKVQVVELEKQGNGDSEIVQEILTETRQTYQFAGRNIKDIEDLIREAEGTEAPSPVSREAFKNSIEAYVGQEKDIGSDAFEDVIDAHNKCIKFLLQKMKSEISKSAEHSFKEKLHHHSDNEDDNSLIETMTKDIIAKFQVIVDYTRDNVAGEPEESQEIQIIQGIKDTVEIKITSILEAWQETKHRLEAQNTALAEIKPVVAEEQINIAVKDIYKLWLEAFAGIVDINTVTAGKAGEIISHQVNGIVGQALEQYDKTMIKQKESIRNTVLSYQRDYLLFEISTFGEIMSYSVSRLKEIVDSPYKEYIEMIEGVEAAINKILEKNGISMINPQPHENFNGKEHEVLMAENREGFEKGQIIKVSNYGYRKGETVIIRANVIAAR